jgi:hypothetical protein
MESGNISNCFGEFEDISPKRKEPTIQVLYEYEKHYLEMLRKYSNEIEFIQKMLSNFREEQAKFYHQVLPDIEDKLKGDEAINDEMRRIWIDRLVANMDRSFNLSESLINDYAVKNLDEFKTAVNEKMRNI